MARTDLSELYIDGERAATERYVVEHASAVRSYEEEFESPLMLWLVNHNLDRYPIALVLSPGGSEIDAEITHLNLNQLTAQFAGPQAGRIRCI